VTVLYVVFYALLVITQQLPECSLVNEIECGANREDNLIWMWTMHFFNASIMGCLSLHLLVYRQCYRPGDSGTGTTLLGGFALACMSLAFMTKGVILISLEDNDEKGFKGNYISTAVFYALMGMSSILFGILFHLTSKRGKTQMILFIVLNIIATILIVFVCVLVASSQPEDHLDNAATDEYLENPSQLPFLLQLLGIGQGLWNASYSLFLLSIAFVWGSMAKQNVVFVMGLPNSLAAAGIIIAQLTVGIFRLLVIINKSNNGETLEDSTTHKLSSLFLEYVMLMTAFFAHNLIFSFLSEEDGEEYQGKDDNDTDYPTDESYHSETSSSQEEEGFTVELNGDVTEISNGINYANYESCGNEVTNSKEASIHSLERNSIDIALDSMGAHDDVESGNCEKLRQVEHIPYRSLYEAVNAGINDGTSSSIDSSENQIESIYGYISSFLPDTQKPVILNNAPVRELYDKGVVPRDQSDDIVSKMASAVTTSAVAAYSAVSSLSRNNPKCEKSLNDSYGEQFIGTRNVATELKSSDIKQQIDCQNEKSVQKFGETVAAFFTEAAPEKITKIDNKSGIKLHDEIPVGNFEEIKVPSGKKYLDAYTDTYKKNGSKEHENVEEIEVPLEKEAIETSKTSCSAEFKRVDKDKNSRNILPHSLSRIRPSQKRKNGKGYRKKSIPLKKLVIQSAIKEVEERSLKISSESGQSHSETLKQLKDCNTIYQKGILIKPEFGGGGGYTIEDRVNSSSVPIYWKRDLSGKVPISEIGNSIHTPGNNTPCQKITNAKSDHVLQPLSNDCLSGNQISKPAFVPEEIDTSIAAGSNPEYVNHSKSIDKEAVLPGRKSQTTEEFNFIHNSENVQEQLSSSNDSVAELDCLNGSLLELKTVLDDGVDPFKYFVSVPDQRRGNNESQVVAREKNSPKYYTKDATNEQIIKQEVQQYSGRQYSRNKQKDASLIPTLLQALTFHSDCVSTLTSDFDENDFSPAPISIDRVDSHPYSMKASGMTTNGDHSGKDCCKEKVFSGNDDVDGKEGRKEDASNCNELHEDIQICKEKEEFNQTNEFEIKDRAENIINEINGVEKSEADTRNASQSTQMIAPPSNAKSEPKKCVEDDACTTTNISPLSLSSSQVPVFRNNSSNNDGRLVPNDENSLSCSPSGDEDDISQFDIEQKSFTTSHDSDLSPGDIYKLGIIEH